MWGGFDLAPVDVDDIAKEFEGVKGHAERHDQPPQSSDRHDGCDLEKGEVSCQQDDGKEGSYPSAVF